MRRRLCTVIEGKKFTFKLPRLLCVIGRGVGSSNTNQALMQLPSCCTGVFCFPNIIKCGEGISDTGRKTTLLSFTVRSIWIGCDTVCNHHKLRIWRGEESYITRQLQHSNQSTAGHAIYASTPEMDWDNSGFANETVMCMVYCCFFQLLIRPFLLFSFRHLLIRSALKLSSFLMGFLGCRHNRLELKQ